MDKLSNNKIELFDELGKSRGYYDKRNKINDLTGKEWLFSTKSVIPKSYPPSFQLQNLRNKHGGQKPPELCAQLINTFTKKGELVLDPLAGVGGTLIGCTLTNRRGIGIEINPKWVNIYKEVCKLEKIKEEEMIVEDSQIYLKTYTHDVDFILTDVPYWLMDKVEKSKGTYKKHGEIAKGIYSDKSKLKSFDENAPKTKEEWKMLLHNVFTECYRVLKHEKYCAIFIGNMYYKKRYHLLTSDLTQILENIGFILKGEIIWYDVAKKLHLYGINYSWIPSIVHQFILIFRKPKAENAKK
ncbi:MAG: class I SAM-dependent methyltransferase [Candidatus Helarchaeota archaeon]|nr:class I SAM-dependent methyltransferase [Candidatus Helarchaeota archaeon]